MAVRSFQYSHFLLEPADSEDMELFCHESTFAEWRFPTSFSGLGWIFFQISLFILQSTLGNCNQCLVFVFVPLKTPWRKIVRTRISTSNDHRKEQGENCSVIRDFYLFIQDQPQNKRFFSTFSFWGTDSTHLLPNSFFLLLGHILLHHTDFCIKSFVSFWCKRRNYKTDYSPKNASALLCYH